MLEVGYRITARLHDRLDEIVGVMHRARWIVDELCLASGPRVVEVDAIGFVELAQVDALQPPLARGELSLRFVDAPKLLHGTLVLRSKALAQPDATASRVLRRNERNP